MRAVLRRDSLNLIARAPSNLIPYYANENDRVNGEVMNSTSTPEWYVSLHGGHSGEFCDHAVSNLRAIIESAIAKGFKTYGVTEHIARVEERFLYPNEQRLGWTIEKVISDFENYAAEVFALAEEYADQITILRGMEGEVVPSNGYVELVRDYKNRFEFDYMVGSVHYVNEISVDDIPPVFEQALEDQDGLEPLALAYYETVIEMVQNLKPEVVGHFDVIRKNGHLYGDVATPAIQKRAAEALEVVKQHKCILDLNTAGYRKGLGCPYPEPWALKLAHDMGIPFCFGDDSHGPEDVGAGLDEARNYLLSNGITAITALGRDGNGVFRKIIDLH